MDIQAFSDRLQLLKVADRDRRVFGAAEHHYDLRPPVAEADVRAFEERYRVRLPEEYREFLTRLGDGGAGPCYGLFPLGVFRDDPSPGRQDDSIGDLTKPFPHKVAWNAGEDYLAAAPNFSEDEDAWWGWQEEYFSPRLIDGALPICHEGCGYFFLLIVTGADRGRIWLDGRSSDDGIMPVAGDDDVSLTFERWYAGWLDEASKAVGLPPLPIPTRPECSGP